MNQNRTLNGPDRIERMDRLDREDSSRRPDHPAYADVVSQPSTLRDRRISRRAALALGAAGALASGLGAPVRGAAAGRAAGRAAGEVRIGTQKGSANLLVLKARGELDKRLGPLGYTVSYVEFTSGPPLLEALNARSIDFGSTGAPPPIFAQAAGTDLVYTLAAKPSPRTQAILVPADSAIQSPADLAGKKVAVAKGSSAHALLVRALRAGGLEWGAAEAVYLQPADAKAAFAGGSVDAWSIWDPYYAAEEHATGARALVDDEAVGANSRGFYLASRAFATEQRPALDAIAAALTESDAWADAHPDDVIRLVAAETGLDPAILATVEDRRVYGIEPITPQVVADQQELADLFFELGLIPTEIDVAGATVPPVAPA